MTLSSSIAALLLGAVIVVHAGEGLPATDHRGTKIVDLNTPRTFQPAASRKEWNDRAAQIRQQVLVSCGLWPQPEKTPLHARVFGKIERDGYSVEKVYFETYPGFFLGGNLYRPLGRGTGPFPGILNPHGHWANGRMGDTDVGSIAGRCINFARQGMVAFSYDMVGYNDTIQLHPPAEGTIHPPGYSSHRRFAADPVHQLWGIGEMGLQTWNSIRALDFLESLPDVDTKRLACTGESGGGTQTFMLGAIDDRLAVQAPIVMVSHTMQGGCSCENAPGLRIDQFNVDIAAAPAPRPQILVGATGDWTKATLSVEGPALESVYRLFNKADQLRYVVFDFGHNYNKTSREAVYAWFGHYLLGLPADAVVKEPPFSKEPDEALRVFPDNKLPDGALSEKQFIPTLIASAQRQLDDLLPKRSRDTGRFREVLYPAWKHALQLDLAERRQVRVETNSAVAGASGKITRLAIGRSGKGDRIPATLFTPDRPDGTLVILAHPAGQQPFLGANGPAGLALELLAARRSVLVFDAFDAGPDGPKRPARNFFTNFYTTYNRTDLQERVQDLVTLQSFARGHFKKVLVIGLEQAGPWALLAAPVMDGCAADLTGIDPSNNRQMLEPALFVPGFYRMGGFTTAAGLASPHPLLLQGATKTVTGPVSNFYAAGSAKTRYRVEANKLGNHELARQVAAW